MKRRKKSHIQIIEPAQCVLWNDPALTAQKLTQGLEEVETFTDDSDFTRRLMKCRECGQLYLKEFLEFADYAGGNDAQYSTWVPVASREQAVQVNRLSPTQLLDLPSIHYNFPTGASAPIGPYRVRGAMQ